MNGSTPTLQAPCRDILILTSSTGAGHDSVAVALQEALRELAPEAGVRVLDPLTSKRRHGLTSPGRWYDAMVAHAPWAWGLFYHATNNALAVRLGMAAGMLLWARRLRTLVETDRPGIVVAVHPVCVRLAAGVLRTMGAAPPLHCVVTDLVTIHRYWASDAVGAFYVATAEARDTLVAQGIPRERLHVTGLPLRASFAQPPHAPAGGAPPRVLVLGGGHPSRRIEKVARALVAAHPALQLVVVCGRNSRLRRRLTRALGTRATVLGWRDDIAALMRWSSVVLTKAGPTTLAEALSQARPVVIFQVLQGQEAGNVALARRTGAGRYVRDPDALARAAVARPCARPAVDMALAAWWGSAAPRVAAGLLTVRAGRDAGLREMPALSGRVIDNPISGERMLIRESGAQTGGRLLSFDLYLPPGAHVPARHVHPTQEEQFTVLAGCMRFQLGRFGPLGGRTIMAHAGDTVRVPAGTAHWFGNAGAGVSHARVEARPALRLEEAFETAAAMGRAGVVPGTRLPRPGDLALFLSEFRRELAVPDVPAFLVRVALSPLAWLARRRGRAAQLGLPR
jgi:UDP-N-acetylglucosamine:LPS N-acetylglucosamine transferase/quercetin dioxygenase-like cupin family protein